MSYYVHLNAISTPASYSVNCNTAVDPLSLFAGVVAPYAVIKHWDTVSKHANEYIESLKNNEYIESLKNNEFIESLKNNEFIESLKETMKENEAGRKARGDTSVKHLEHFGEDVGRWVVG